MPQAFAINLLAPDAVSNLTFSICKAKFERINFIVLCERFMPTFGCKFSILLPLYYKVKCTGNRFSNNKIDNRYPSLLNYL